MDDLEVQHLISQHRQLPISLQFYSSSWMTLSSETTLSPSQTFDICWSLLHCPVCGQFLYTSCIFRSHRLLHSFMVSSLNMHRKTLRFILAHSKKKSYVCWSVWTSIPPFSLECTCWRTSGISLFLRFYSSVFRERGREEEKKKNINVWLPLVGPLLGLQAMQAGALTGNRTSDLSVHSVHWATPGRVNFRHFIWTVIPCMDLLIVPVGAVQNVHFSCVFLVHKQQDLEAW